MPSNSVLHDRWFTKVCGINQDVSSDKTPGAVSHSAPTFSRSTDPLKQALGHAEFWERSATVHATNAELWRRRALDWQAWFIALGLIDACVLVMWLFLR